MKRFILILFLSVIIQGQDFNDTTKYKLIIPAEEYKAGYIYQLLFGKHWRDLWTAPVYAEILNLDTYKGGLVPIEKGGGFQTKSLRFLAKDGNIYKFRSIRKDPAKVLPEELQETVVADILFDQISSSNPFAALTVVPILNAVNIPQAYPQIVFLPDTEKLGEFRDEFKNLLGLIEIHPNENEKDTALFFGADKILSTYKLLDRLEEKRDERVDSKAYLTARLIDAFLGDWDRHTDQWRWARITKNNKKIWLPIPRDRDQVYSLFDGLFPNIAALYVKQLNSFAGSFPNPEYLSWSGRALDDRFLPELNKAEWDSVTNFVVNTLTDSLIEYSISRLPKSNYELAGTRLVDILKERRSKLTDYSNDFFDFIHNVVSINAYKKDDFALINRVNDNTTNVSIFNKKKDKLECYYNVNFDNNVTSEIRLDMLDGDDKVLVKGSVANSPIIRVVGGKGNDYLIDSSTVRGYFNYKTKTYFYDSDKDTKFVTGFGTKTDNSFYPYPKTDEERFEPGTPQKGDDIFYYPYIEYNGTNGIILGINPEYSKYNFRMFPNEYQISGFAAYASIPKTYHLGIFGKFNNIIKSLPVTFSFFRTKLLLTNYYGYGNLTVYDKELDEHKLYKLNQEVTKISLGLEKDFTETIKLYLNAELRFLETNIYNPLTIATLPYNKNGIGKYKSLLAETGIIFDYRDSKTFPTNGYYLSLNYKAYPKFYENGNFYQKLKIDVRTYLNAEFFNNSVLALRFGGEKNFGAYPFFDACYLGGKENLRGYVLERFSGDGSLFFQSDLRLPISNVKIIVNGKLGILAFAETGKVFTNIFDKKWHPSFGSGLWFSAIKNRFNIVYNIGFSEELVTHYVQTKFGF
jgi:hypothetical protein